MRSTRNFRPPFLTALAIRRGEGGRQPYASIDCDFVTVRPLTVSGVLVPAGAPFDKGTVSERTLRQLYTARSIGLAPGSLPVVPPPRPLAVGPAEDARTPPKQHLPEKKRGIARIRRAA